MVFFDGFVAGMVCLAVFDFAWSKVFPNAKRMW